MPETSTDTVSELRAAVARAAGLGQRRRGRRGGRAVARATAEGRARRLQHQCRDAAGRARWAAARARSPRRSPPSCARGSAGSVERVEVAGPGFVNLFLSDALVRARRSRRSPRRGSGLGAEPAPSPSGCWSSSSPPTRPGPLTAAGGRHAAFGDAVARLLAAVGHEVGREYYVNDQGGQIERFAASIAAAMSGGPAPEDGYEGDYVGELAERARRGGGRPGRSRGRWAIAGSSGWSSRSGRRFNATGSTSTPGPRSGTSTRPGRPSPPSTACGTPGTPMRAMGRSGCARPSSATTRTGSCCAPTASPTYFAGDVAYHWEKLERGYERLINVLGADHHGYMARMRAAIECLGRPGELFEVVIMQFVHIVESGGRSQMSKREGEFVTLDELVDDIGVDATRFFMLQRSHETTVDLDLDLARRESNENPVYYVQYAHARISSILRKAAEAGARPDPGAGRGAGAVAPLEPAERVLVKRMLELPGRSPRPPSAALPTGSAPTRPRPRPTSTPSTATARCSAPRARGWRRRGCALPAGPPDDRPHPRAARDLGAGADVAADAFQRRLRQGCGGGAPKGDRWQSSTASFAALAPRRPPADLQRAAAR